MNESLNFGFRHFGPGQADIAREAEECFRHGYEAQMGEQLEEAIDWYRRSIDLFPTAEAHTFLGWAYSFRGDLESAIRECERAIEIDPEFGNPYNDIGAYLIELGRHEDAVEWLERAKNALRYDPKHFPYVNLARVYILQGRTLEAISELKASLSYFPENEPARRELRRLTAKCN